MKQIILVLILTMAVSTTFGQDKWQQKKIDYFVEAATKEFKLDNKQKKELLVLRTDYFNDYMVIIKNGKEGEITEEEQKTQLNEHNQNFNIKLKEITGSNNIQPFLVRMRDELKNVK
ncbi:hypothetical protein EV196_103295 [Mariniflexile fucanivorans]|uniref:Uncharacterized protein n=1 Tax=Mariniflexile fucanivorans TaxID=264023 RepID=A0A4R1RLA6_9FLAO|nr:hypothetical protein [Mariniflexile fucanivorans]TCL66876.1 hypothetical protein EV196_103295 [Mariniflexile fucanivorans]